MVKGSSRQDNGVVIGPFGGVAPGALQGVPEVAPGRVTHDALREAPPNQEGKVNLKENIYKHFSTFVLLCSLSEIYTHLTGQQHRVLVQTQHGLRLYGNVR